MRLQRTAHRRACPHLPCCATERHHFDDDDELFIFVQKDMYSKTYKGLIIYLQTKITKRL